MGSRKEDEKNERIIRGLLKLPENRRCINCNSLGPQYVCTNFWTFVCTNCSGIHREFTHRVKSVSMAKFTSQEVKSLQEGGNQPAKELFLKELDPQRNSFPDSSNVERLRDFIKHVYEDRRYTGERNADKPPRGKMGDKEDSYENRRQDSYQGGSRSPPYDDERRYSERSSPGGRSYEGQRSPGYDQESRQYGDSKRSPSRPEVVNDWRREDRFGNGRKFDDRRSSDEDTKLDSKSPERPRDIDSFSPPMVRPVRDILGDKTIPLRIIEPPKVNSVRATDGSVLTQRTASSSSLGSANGNPAEVKLETPGSLIDFDADIEPPAAPAVPQAQQTSVTQPYSQPVNSHSDNNWASFDAAPQAKVSQAPANVNSLESLLSELSVSTPAPSYSSGNTGDSGAFTGLGDMTAPFGSVIPPVGHTLLPPSTGSHTVAPPTSSYLPAGAPVPAPGLGQMFPPNAGNLTAAGSGQWPSMQHQQPSLYPAHSIQSASQQYIPSAGGASSNQPWNLAHGQVQSNPVAPAPQDFPRSIQNAGTIPSQPSVGDAKPTGRSALPEDLFAMNYSFFPAPVPGWQTGHAQGMGLAMQYNNAPPMPMPTFQQSFKSANPFDVNSEPSPVQVSAFPSMASSQGVLPNMQPPSGLVRTASLGTPSSAWIPHQSPYSSGMPLQPPPYAPQMPPSAYTGQQVSSSLPPSGYQGAGGFGGQRADFGSSNMDQQLGGRFSAPATPNPFPSAGGNPFG